MKRNEGLTLLELLVGMAIMGLIAVVIFQSLSLGVRAWERGDQIAETNQQKTFDLMLAARQIRSACPEKGKGNNVYFQGDKDGMSFISAYSLFTADQSGLVRVVYFLDRSDKQLTRLMVYEEPFLDDDQLDGKVNPDDFLELTAVDGDITLMFEKTGPAKLGNEETAEWVQEWKEDDNGLPRSLRIVVSDKGWERELVIPIMAYQAESKR